MINSIYTNSAAFTPSISSKLNNAAQGANNTFSLAANPVKSQSVSFALDTLGGNALVSAGMQLPGGGWMNASVCKAENYSEDNPVFLVKGTNVDGAPFEAEININKINPRSASFVELFALDGYNAANGQLPGVASAAARAAAWAASVSNPFGSSGCNDAFAQFDCIPSLLEMMETQRFHGNLNGYLRYKEIIDSLLGFIAQK